MRFFFPIVSVPLRGLWFLSIFDKGRSNRICKFPSPCGDYGSYHVSPLSLNGNAYSYVSVPLRGLWFLSCKCESWSFGDFVNVSVPLRGLWFLSEEYGDSIVDYHCNVSVPLRGLWFLSAPFINAFMKPSKWHFAGRIIYFHHFLSFAGK